MAEAKITLTAENKASGVINQVLKELGLFNKEGLATGVTFALVTKGVQLAEQALNSMIQYIQKGIQKNREFDYSLAQLSVSVNDLGVSMGDIRSTIKDFGLTFGQELNTISNALRTFMNEGYNVTESMQLLYETMKLHAVYGGELVDTQNAVNTVMEVFDLKASDVGYVTRMLNIIMSNTGMSINAINNVISQLAPNIQDANIGFSTFSDYLYTVEKTGAGPKKLVTELADAFKDLNFELENMPTDRTPAVEEKIKTMMGTKQFQQQIEQQYQDQLQTERGGLFDFGENRAYKTALENVQAGKTKYETASSYYLSSEKIQKYMDLIRAATNVELEGIKETYAGIVAKQEEQEKAAKQFIDDQVTIATNTEKIITLGREMAKDRHLLQYTKDMHEATLAVQQQQDAIEQLDRINKRYGLQQQANQLEIMQIQYGAMGRRGGRLTRGEEKTIHEYERMNMGLQIEEQKNQLKIGGIQLNGLQSALDAQEQIRRNYSEIAYQQDISDLAINLAAQKTMYETFFAEIRAMRESALSGGFYGTTTTTPAKKTIKKMTPEVWLAQLQTKGIRKRLFSPSGFSYSE